LPHHSCIFLDSHIDIMYTARYEKGVLIVYHL
jgi:hypothetical protein